MSPTPAQIDAPAWAWGSARQRVGYGMDEDRFLAELLPRLTRDIAVPPGDDCAALAWGDGDLLLLAVDQLVADVHYHGPSAARPTPPELAGRKLLARNLSDIAAMGGRPTHALLTLAAPRDADATWHRRFVDGLLALAAEWDTALIGGDLARAPALVATLTIVGRVAADRVCRRDTARAGQMIVVTGAFGGSLPSGRHLNFTPRLREAAALADAGCRCLIDVSDGLLQDLSRVARASGLQACIDPDAIPRHPGCDLAAALADGEDYELIAAIDPAAWPALQARWTLDTPLTAIGEWRPAAPDVPLVRDAAGQNLRDRAGRAFRHFDPTPETG